LAEIYSCSCMETDLQ